jgi:hypothetical protein
MKNSVLHSLFFSVLLLLCASFAHGQSSTLTGTQCFPIDTGGRATVALQVTGSWSGSIQPQAAIQGQSAVNLQVTPVASSTPQSTVTANGAYVVNVAGYSMFQVCGATITGTANIYANLSKFTH